MTETNTYILCFIFCFISTLLLQYFFHRSKTTKPSSSLRRLPPSPPSIPLLGHLHLLSPSLHKSFTALSSKFGPLLCLQLGAVRCIVVSSASLATEVFKTQDLAFSSRPKFAFSDETPYGSSGFFAAPYGDYWRFMKKLTMTELLAPKQVERSRVVRYEEVLRFLRKMVAAANDNQLVDVGAELMKLTNNSICRMMMSIRCADDSDESEKIRQLVKDTMEVGAKVAFGDVVGWPLKRVAFWVYGKQAIDVTMRYDAILEKALKQHEERGKVEGFDRDDRDLMDIILKVHQDSQAEFKITRTNVKAFLLDLFVGGTGTSTEVMQWIIAELINHPKELKKLREEILSVVGDSRLVQETDVPHMPYLQAVVKEGLRMYPAVPVAMRSCPQSCKINGYDIPENTMVGVNLFAIMRDPNSWEDPNEFRPERFISPAKESDGGMKQIQYEIKGQNFNFVPFGGGRRGCPGSTLAFTTSTVVIAAMVQCFDWKVDGKEEKKANMEIGSGLGLPMAHPLNCVPVVKFNPFASN
ncbi:cytochrome P450 705A22-like [Cucumis melo]|uniref:Cytochrome P450 705A5-like n=1 Tax=Cucumis melo TaxID=3656 RepID=A0A1S3CFI7_CUCME|nr:cytochrome P450 705A22-like [Cucumis melo]